MSGKSQTEEGRYRMWKKGQAAWEEYRNIIRVYRGGEKEGWGLFGIKSGKECQGQQEGLLQVHCVEEKKVIRSSQHR